MGSLIVPAMDDGRTTEMSAEINVTPMIDVLLSLLIIFMVASPPPPNVQQPIDVPQEPITEVPDDPNSTLLVTIDAKGKAKLGDSDLPDGYDAIVQAFKDSEKAQTDGRVAISAEGKAAYGRVIEIMGAAREAGIPSVGLASDRL